ncbi:hypothetical protein [Acuticoccus sediminis]|uniref:hypothetical protein n=1 Tax=Acuticoccus sediminis TaxID=2184697 RepID=UPI0011B94262|nr:hypothetical protein [Acuticoccus sediminis]
MSHPHRRHIPLSVKLKSVLLMLGFPEEAVENDRIEWDHDPALALRFEDPTTGELVPAPNDFRYLTPRLKEDHAIKTNGGTAKATTAGSDVHRIRKTERMSEGHTEFRRRILAKTIPDETPAPTRAKRKMRSRPFPKRTKA